jgi:magnesium chelatase family protein
VLVASGALDPRRVENTAFIGELGLDGSLRGVPGTLVLAEALDRYRLVVPATSGHEAVVAREGEIRMSGTLGDVVEQLSGHRPWSLPTGTAAPFLPATGPTTAPSDMDLSDVRGQRLARRALEVAAAGGHHLLLVGPPGSGKTMLANRLPGLLPDLSRPRALEVTRVHSVAGLPLTPCGLIDRPPFRAPHHGASPVAMIGGGSGVMRPGEISLAHGGISECHLKKGQVGVGKERFGAVTYRHLCHTPRPSNERSPAGTEGHRKSKVA